jgi:hypothetical protein
MICADFLAGENIDLSLGDITTRQDARALSRERGEEAEKGEMESQ